MKSYSKTSRKKAILTLLGFFVIFTLLSKRGLDTSLKNPVINAFSPLMSVTRSFIFETKQNLWALLNFYKLNNMIHSAETRINQLEQKLLDTEEIRRENDRLKDLLNYKTNLGFKTVAAQIIGEDSSNFYSSILINKGQQNGVFVNNIVLCPEGYVGQVVEVYSKSAKVMLITDKNSRLGGMLAKSRDRGILNGEDKSTCHLRYLPREARIDPGDLVITSGMDDIAPKGILLGEVTSVREDVSGLYKEAVILSSVNFSKLEEVLVLSELVNPAPDSNPESSNQTGSTDDTANS